MILPQEPYSFTGTLIALSWALEAVALPNEENSERYTFELTPDGQAITLTPVTHLVTAKKKNRLLKFTNE